MTPAYFFYERHKGNDRWNRLLFFACWLSKRALSFMLWVLLKRRNPNAKKLIQPVLAVSFHQISDTMAAQLIDAKPYMDQLSPATQPVPELKQ